MFAIVLIVPDLAVILLHGAAVDVIAPANTVQLRDPSFDFNILSQPIVFFY